MPRLINRLVVMFAVIFAAGASPALAGPDLKYSGKQVLYPEFAGTVYEFEGGDLDGQRGYLFTIENQSDRPVTLTTVRGQFKKNPKRYRSFGTSYADDATAFADDPGQYELLFQDGSEIINPTPSGEADVPNIVVITDADVDRFTLQLRGRKARARFDDAEVKRINLDSALPPLVLSATANRAIGTTATVFELRAEVLRDEAAAGEVRWTVSDGRTLTGPEPEIFFNTPGGYEVTAEVTDAEGNVATSELAFLVYDRATGQVPGLDVAPTFGDANLDGEVTLADALLTAQAAARLKDLADEDAERAADVDVDGDVTDADARLIAQAVAEGSALPSALLTTSGLPGTFVTIVSPNLLDLDASYELRFGESAAFDLNRIVPGYATFSVPLDYASPGSVSSTEGEFPVEVLRDGVVVDEFAFVVTAPPAQPADPKEEVRAFLNTLSLVLSRSEDALAGQLELTEATDREKELLLAASKGGIADAADAFEEMNALLDEEGGENLARAFLIYARANGLDEFMAEAEGLLEGGTSGTQGGSASSITMFGEPLFQSSSSLVSPAFVCDEALPAFCTLKDAASLLKKGNKIVSTACDVLAAAAVGATVIPLDGPLADAALWASWAAACLRVEATVKVTNTVASFVDNIDADLRLDISSSRGSSDQPVTISPMVEFFGADDLCVLVGDKGTDKFIKFLTKQTTNELLRDSISVKAMKQLFSLGGERRLQQFFNTIESVVEETIKTTGVSDLFKPLADLYCSRLGGDAAPIDSARYLKDPDPNIGSIFYNSDGSATFTCPETIPDGESGTVKFTAEKTICKAKQTKSGTVACDAGTKPVTITIGDDGSLNDDIFEVQIDGATVLTSSSPTRSISTTVDLPTGRNTVVMLGRAAPDGVGTYFIRFGGASVVSGRTSGSDLTPGTSKTFVIDVQ